MPEHEHTPGRTPPRRVPWLRSRHVSALLRFVLTILVSYGVLALIGQTLDVRTLFVPGLVVHLDYTSSLIEQWAWIAGLVAFALLLRWLLPSGPRVTWRQRRRDKKTYREIERALDSFVDGRMRYTPSHRVVFVNAGTHWKPRVVRFTLDEDSLPAVDEVGEVPGDVLTLSPLPPKVLRYAEIMPLTLTDDGELAADEELLARMAPPRRTPRERYAALRLSLTTGSAWLSSDELATLAAQLRQATVFVNP